MLFGFSGLVVGPLALGLFMSLVRFHARDVAPPRRPEAADPGLPPTFHMASPSRRQRRLSCPRPTQLPPRHLVRGRDPAAPGAVAVQSREEEEIVLRVRVPGRPVAVTVVLYPGEREWDCDCGGRVSPCEHVAAAAIALGAGDDGPVEAGGRGPRRRPAGGGSSTVLPAPRAGCACAASSPPARDRRSRWPARSPRLLSQPALAATVQPEQHDLRADLLLEAGAGGVLAAQQAGRPAARCWWGPATCCWTACRWSIVEEEVLPRAVIEDSASEVVVTIGRDPRVVEVVSPAVALCSDGTLARLGETELSGGWLQNLPIRNRYRAAESGRAGDPRAARSQPAHGGRGAQPALPRVVRDLEPRISLDLQHLDGGQTCRCCRPWSTASPPCVRIDEGRMVHLRGPVPVRAADRERRLVERLRDELNLMPGRRAQLRRRATRGCSPPSCGAGGARLTGEAAAASSAPGPGSRPGCRCEAPPARRRGRGGPLRSALRGGRTSGDGPAAGGGRFVDAGGGGARLAGGAGAGARSMAAAGRRCRCDWLAKHGQRLADLLAARESRRPRGHPRPARAGARCATTSTTRRPPSLQRLAPLLAGFERLPDGAAARRFHRHLAPLPAAGASTGWPSCARRAWAASWPTTWASARRCRRWRCCAGASKTLVVCPTSVLPNWQARAEPLPARRCRSAPTTAPAATLDPEADVVLTTYALLRLDAERLRRARGAALGPGGARRGPGHQEPGQPGGPRRLRARAPTFRLALTGTPVENRLDELWSLLHFTNRGLLGRAARLRGALRPAHRRRGRRRRPRRCAARSSPSCCAGTSRRWRPSCRRAPRRCCGWRSTSASASSTTPCGRPPGPTWWRCWTAGGRVMKALEALLRLRQAACHPALLPGPGGAHARPRSSAWWRRWSWRRPRGTRRWCSRSGPRCST